MAKIKHNVSVKASLSKVYDAITKIKELQNWWTTDTSGDPSKNGELRFGFGGEMFNVMKITTLKPNKEVKWTCTKGPQEWIDTKISFSIAEDRDKHTQIIFEHDGWKDASDFYGMCNYHWGLYLKSLKTLCETGKGAPHVVEK